MDELPVVLAAGLPEPEGTTVVDTLSPRTRSEASNEPRAVSTDTGEFQTRRAMREAETGRIRTVSPAPATFVLEAKKPAPKLGKKSMQSRIIAMLTLILIPGFIAASSIPASAFGLAGGSGAGQGTELSSTDGQTVVVASGALAADVSRDGFDATTADELAAAKRATVIKAAADAARASAGKFSVVGPRAAGDDYPYRNSGGLSPMGYVIRQCTDFVAWRLNRDAGVKDGNYKYVWAMMTPNGGSASQWASAWRNNGWKTSHKPVAGAVAWFMGNHVAYVKSIDKENDQVTIEEYNWNGDQSYHMRTIGFDEVGLFLYPPP